MPDVLTDIDKNIFRITLNRPDKRNAVSMAMRGELMQALEECERLQPRIVIISGAGGAFCSGQDLSERRGADSPDLEASILGFYAPFANRLRALPCPVIAQVPGVAAGAGASLALLCDIVVAAETAMFIQPFTAIGLIPDVGGTWLLPRLVGDARARAMIMLGEPVSGAEAARIGLIWKAVPADELDAAVSETVDRLLERPPTALAASKKALHVQPGNSLEAQIEWEAKMQGALGRTPEYKAAVERFFSRKGKPL